MRRRPLIMNGGARPRIQIWMQLAFLAVLVAYLAFMSVVGGAVLARYMLPVVPLVVLVMVSTLWRRVRYWRLVIVLVAIAFVAALFTNPPYGSRWRITSTYRDYVVMHAEADRFLALRYPRARVLTAWPASDELSGPGSATCYEPFQSCALRTSRRVKLRLPRIQAASSTLPWHSRPSISRRRPCWKTGRCGNYSKKNISAITGI